MRARRQGGLWFLLSAISTVLFYHFASASTTDVSICRGEIVQYRFNKAFFSSVGKSRYPFFW